MTGVTEETIFFHWWNLSSLKSRSMARRMESPNASPHVLVSSEAGKAAHPVPVLGGAVVVERLGEELAWGETMTREILKRFAHETIGPLAVYHLVARTPKPVESRLLAVRLVAHYLRMRAETT